MNAFVTMRKYISNNLLEQRYINNMMFEHDERISLLEDTFSKFDTFSNEIFFEGQIYDAYSLLLDIFNTSNKNIIIIDNKVLYHCGASFKDLGKKCFAINKIEDKEMLYSILNIL